MWIHDYNLLCFILIPVLGPGIILKLIYGKPSFLCRLANVFSMRTGFCCVLTRKHVTKTWVWNCTTRGQTKFRKHIVLGTEPYFYWNKQTFDSRCTNYLWCYGVLLMFFFMEFLASGERRYVLHWLSFHPLPSSRRRGRVPPVSIFLEELRIWWSARAELQFVWSCLGCLRRLLTRIA